MNKFINSSKNGDELLFISNLEVTAKEESALDGVSPQAYYYARVDLAALDADHVYVSAVDADHQQFITKNDGLI